MCVCRTKALKTIERITFTTKINGITKKTKCVCFSKSIKKKNNIFSTPSQFINTHIYINYTYYISSIRRLHDYFKYFKTCVYLLEVSTLTRLFNAADNIPTDVRIFVCAYLLHSFEIDLMRCIGFFNFFLLLLLLQSSSLTTLKSTRERREKK